MACESELGRVHRRDLVKAGLSFGLVVAGLFLLAFSTVNMIYDPMRTEFEEDYGQANLFSDLAGVVIAGLLLGWGVPLGFSAISRAEGASRHVALTALGGSVFLLVVFHAKLFVNAYTTSAIDGGSVTILTAGYIFHTGTAYTFAAVYVLFLLTVVLLATAAAAAALLVVPERFQASFGAQAPWRSHEALVVSTSIFVVLSLTVFLVFLVALALQADQRVGGGFLADNVVGLHYLTAFFIGLLILTIAARVFLVNWGVHGRFRTRAVIDALANVARIERVLLGLVLLFDLLLLLAPPIADAATLSTDPVFRLTTRTLAFFLIVVMVPYALYAYGLRRLGRRLTTGQGPPGDRTPFSDTSMWTVLGFAGGILILTALWAATAGPQASPLVLLILYSGFAAMVFLVAGVRFTLQQGVPTPRFRNAGGASNFLAFLVLGSTTCLMLWGAGNTYEATYFRSTQTMRIENASVWGADVLARFASALAFGIILVLGLGALTEATRLRRPLLLNHLALLLSVVVGALVVFTVGVWSIASQGGIVENAYAGLAFHRYYALEKTLVAAVIVGMTLGFYFGMGRVLALAAQRRTLRSSVVDES
jgi:hypothetical protein